MVQEETAGDDVVSHWDWLAQQIELKKRNVGPGPVGRLFRMIDGDWAQVAAGDFQWQLFALAKPPKSDGYITAPGREVEHANRARVAGLSLLVAEIANRRPEHARAFTDEVDSGEPIESLVVCVGIEIFAVHDLGLEMPLPKARCGHVTRLHNCRASKSNSRT